MLQTCLRRLLRILRTMVTRNNRPGMRRSPPHRSSPRHPRCPSNPRLPLHPVSRHLSWRPRRWLHLRRLFPVHHQFCLTQHPLRRLLHHPNRQPLPQLLRPSKPLPHPQRYRLLPRELRLQSPKLPPRLLRPLGARKFRHPLRSPRSRPPGRCLRLPHPRLPRLALSPRPPSLSPSLNPNPHLPLVSLPLSLPHPSPKQLPFHLQRLLRLRQRCLATCPP